MKVIISLSLAAIVLVGGFTYSEVQQSILLTQQIADYARQNSQLLAQIENNSLKNSESAKALRTLQSELNNRDSQLATLTRQLDLAQQQIDPDYQEIETRIRQQLTREIQANDSTLNRDPRIAVLKQLSELDPMMMGEIMALNAQYGEFISGLDVSEERKEVIINALHNLIADQNQARVEIMLDMQSNPQLANRGDLFEQMRAISDPSSQLETLAYDLSENELDAFAEYQKERQGASASFSVLGGTSNSPVGGPVFLENDVIQGESIFLDNGFIQGEPIFLGNDLIQGGTGQSPAIQIPPANRSN